VVLLKLWMMPGMLVAMLAACGVDLIGMCRCDIADMHRCKSIEPRSSFDSISPGTPLKIFPQRVPCGS
jgi:hypothetical protein